MSPLKFKALPGDVYEVRRDGVLLGQVARVEAMKSVVGPNKARLSTVVRWQLQVVGQERRKPLYVTRQKAAQALAIHFDAHQRVAKGGAA
ncbi:hypothetical protein [Myxococcus sp. Y35]|uniref:hypothetical protein n=1 Tax=Pseudomyxococcus flavus TaxID=3115648 RepID=UPI003CF6A51C